MKIQNLFSILLLVSSAFSQTTNPSTNDPNANTTDINSEQANFKYGKTEYKILIVGDTGTESTAKKVMKLASNYKVLIHLGDYDYIKRPDAYFDDVLSSSRTYKFMGVIGNHESEGEIGTGGLKQYLSNIKQAMAGLSCKFSGDKDDIWSCVYENMRVIGLSSGISGSTDKSQQLSFLKTELENAKEDWVFCAWHLYDEFYHTGKYDDDYGKNLVSGDYESFYDVCRKQGAIILSAHDHVYGRTKVMSSFKNRLADEFNTVKDIAQIRKGATFNILNGAGGYEMYVEKGVYKTYSHWVKKYALGDNGENAKNYGGLYCTMNVGGNSKKAKCDFLRLEDDDNDKFDSFTIYQNPTPQNLTYNDIDAQFENEKLLAFEKAFNIPNAEEANKRLNEIEKLQEKEALEKEMEDKQKPINKTVWIISSTTIVAFVLGVALFINYSRKKKDDTKKEFDEYDNKEGSETSKANLNTNPDNNDFGNNYRLDIKTEAYPQTAYISSMKNSVKDLNFERENSNLYLKTNKKLELDYNYSQSPIYIDDNLHPFFVYNAQNSNNYDDVERGRKNSNGFEGMIYPNNNLSENRVRSKSRGGYSERAYRESGERSRPRTSGERPRSRTSVERSRSRTSGERPRPRSRSRSSPRVTSGNFDSMKRYHEPISQPKYTRNDYYDESVMSARVYQESKYRKNF